MASYRMYAHTKRKVVVKLSHTYYDPNICILQDARKFSISIISLCKKTSCSFLVSCCCVDCTVGLEHSCQHFNKIIARFLLMTNELVRRRRSPYEEQTWTLNEKVHNPYLEIESYEFMVGIFLCHHSIFLIHAPCNDFLHSVHWHFGRVDPDVKSCHTVDVYHSDTHREGNDVHLRAIYNVVPMKYQYSIYSLTWLL